MRKIENKTRISVVILFILFIVTPLIPLILSSFSHGWRWPEIIPHEWSTRAWEYVFTMHSGTWDAVLTSLEIAFLVTIINLLLALPAASVLGRVSFKGKWLIEGLFYAPIIVPAFVSVMGMYMTFIRFGWTDSMTGVIIAHLIPTMPYMIRALVISYQTLGFQWEEQGQMLGAGSLQRFRYIVIPHLVPGIVAGSSLSILVSLNQYIITFLVGGGQVMTLPLVMFPFISGGDLAIGSAQSLIFIGIAIIALFVMDYLLKHYYNHKVMVHV
ncbi:ABC transporter permease subunit [Radiobacillus kanasensis]|uniref:ABC transporter permease n=1 Tax=Radiobacillus kanasensis TaxID=2844358 RepID=UPI001E5F234A|nr:ABC transporter permease subunit [Radiobacillus kanasensis]UFT98635.1 ABC transporter permease subunit [Radiobacillus kanasensis]